MKNARAIGKLEFPPARESGMTPAELQDVVTHLSAPLLRKRSDEAHGHNAIEL